MKRAIAVVTTLISLLVLAVFLAAPSIAEEPVDLDALREQRAEMQERYVLRKLTQKRINAAADLLEAGQYDEAAEILDRLNPDRLNPYERALMYRFRAFAAIGQEESDRAIENFELALDQQALHIDEEASIRFNIAEIQASLERWEDLDETLTEWFKYVEEPNGKAYYYLAISRYQRELYDEAIGPALAALETSPRPDERWLQLVAALHLQNEDFDAAIPILEELVTRFGKKQYWVQLSLIYGARGDYENALSVQQLAYAQGYLTTDEELQRLARSYLYHQLPYPAAQVLERGLAEGQIAPDREVLELLGNSWIAAREYEKSIEPLRRAAELAEDGRLYLRLGQVRVQREEWREATMLIKKAIEKGGLEDLGKAQMLLGIAYFGDGQPRLASRAFRRAREHESTRKDANAWLDHIARQSQGQSQGQSEEVGQSDEVESQEG